jgi:translation elongation factor EF-G
MKDYLRLWAEGLPNQPSRLVSAPITVIGERIKALGPKAEFAKVQLTVRPSESFEVIDRVPEKTELEKLGVGWPDSSIFGLLDVLMFTKSGPLYKICVVLEGAWYHEVDSSRSAFRHAGRAAGRQIVEAIEDDAQGSQTALVLD